MNKLKMVSPGVTFCKHGLYLRGCTKQEIEEHLLNCFEEENVVPSSYPWFKSLKTPSYLM